MSHFQFRASDGLELLICEPLERIGFTNAFSTRGGGVSPLPQSSLSLGNFSQDEGANVRENRRRFLAALGASDWTLVTARQIHSTDVRTVADRDDARAEPQPGDALIANLADVLLAVQTADCLPILLADPRSGAAAAVHAGWRGTLGGIVARTVKEMQLRFGTRPADLYVALGPAIGPCCFEVGPEVIAQFHAEYPYAEDLTSHPQANGKANLNLNLANRRQLIDAGVADERIFDCKLCTVCHNHLFFSYRRERGAEKPVGRLMGVIGRRG